MKIFVLLLSIALLAYAKPVIERSKDGTVSLQIIGDDDILYDPILGIDVNSVNERGVIDSEKLLPKLPESEVVPEVVPEAIPEAIPEVIPEVIPELHVPEHPIEVVGDDGILALVPPIAELSPRPEDQEVDKEAEDVLAIKNGEIYRDNSVVVQINPADSGILSTLKGWFSMVVNKFTGYGSVESQVVV